MTDWSEDRLLAFLEGELEEPERTRLLEELESDPDLASALREAAAGLGAVKALVDVQASDAEPGPVPAGPRTAGVSPWWVAAASIATLFVSVPTTATLAGGDAESTPRELGIPTDSDPSFALVLHGRWDDAGSVEQAEAGRRAEEYWGWTSRLAEEGRLLGAGDLSWEVGERLGPVGAVAAVSTTPVESTDFMVGMIVVRAGDYEEALELARGCPHLRYGGSVSVRRVGAGFVSVPGVDDWSE